MSGEKTTNIEIVKSLGVLGIFCVGIGCVVVLSFVGLLISWWFLLPVGLFLIGFFALAHVIGGERSTKQLEDKPFEKEIKEEYVDQLDYAIKQFTKYAEGEISKEDIGISEDSSIYQFLWSNLKAQLMMC